MIRIIQQRIIRLVLLFSRADRTAYIPRYEFLENESTNEYLVFKWRPSVDGVFPKGVWMHMWQLLDHFKPSEYVFEIIPGKKLNFFIFDHRFSF